MPTPRSDESQDEWMSRCMGDEEARSDFPDRDQRAAFCLSHWENKTKGGIMSDMESVTLSGQVTKVDEDRRIAYGWFSVIEDAGKAVVDRQGDVIGEDTLVKAVHEFVLDSRAGKMMHKGRRVADIVESMVFTKDVQKALGVDLGRVGWFGAMKFRDDDVWEKVKSGELKAFSIGGTAAAKEV